MRQGVTHEWNDTLRTGRVIEQTFQVRQRAQSKGMLWTSSITGDDQLIDCINRALETPTLASADIYPATTYVPVRRVVAYLFQERLPATR